MFQSSTSAKLLSLLLVLPLTAWLWLPPQQEVFWTRASAKEAMASDLPAPAIALFANTIVKRVPFKAQVDGQELARNGMVTQTLTKGNLPFNLYLKAVPNAGSAQASAKEARYKVFLSKITLRSKEQTILKTFTFEGDVLELKPLEKDLQASDQLDIEVLTIKGMDATGKVVDAQLPPNARFFSLPIKS